MSTDFLKNINYLQGFQLILSRFNNLGLITSIIPKYRRAVAVFDYYNLKIREKKKMNYKMIIFKQFLYYVLLNFTCATILFFFFLINKFFIYFILIIEKNMAIWVKINHNIHRIKAK